MEVVLAIKRWLFEQNHYRPQDGEFAFYAEDQNYVEIRNDGHAFSTLWERFREAIQHEHRFFNDAARDLLYKIFDDIHRLSGANKDKAIYIAGPGEPLNRVYRVQRADTKEA